MARRLSVVCIVVVLLVARTAVCSAAAAAEGDAPTVRFEKLDLKALDGTKLDAEIGRIEVPENRNRAQSGTIELAFIRVRSLAKEPGPPIFFLAGGPGGSSVESVRQMLLLNPQPLLKYGDMIGIDQRGVGLSRPNLRLSLLYAVPMAEPGEPERLLTLALEKHRSAAQQLRNKGIDLAGYTTEESADDIDAVRAALGYERIVLWGGSYGSHLAFATIRRHDAVLDRVIVRSPEGPDHTLKLPEQIQEGLERVSELVAADRTVGPHVPDLVALVSEVLERLDASPVVVETKLPKAKKTISVGISRFDVQRWVAGAIGRVGTMRRVPAVLYAASQGDFEPLAQQLVPYRGVQGVSGMAMMMDCASGISPQRAALIREQRDRCVLGDAVNFPFMRICEAWGCPDLGAEFRGPLESDVKVLFICGDLDSRTPVRNARELMRGLPNSVLLVLENAGHDMPLFSPPEIPAAFDAFLMDRPLATNRIRLKTPKFDPIEQAGDDQ